MVITNIEICLEQKYSLLNSTANITNKMSTLFVFGQEIFSWLNSLQVFTSHQIIQLAQQLTKKCPLNLNFLPVLFRARNHLRTFYERMIKLFLTMNSFCAMNSTRNRYLLNFFTMLVTCN